MNNLSLSIVIPAFNYAHTLPRAIGSIATQARLPLEVIVVDDGSRDNTGEVIASLQDQYPCLAVRYIKQENQGPSRARNRGIAEAAGDYVMLLDADDELFPVAVECLTSKAESVPAELVIGASVSVTETGRERVHDVGEFSNQKEENLRRFLQKESGISHGRFIVKKSVFEKIQYPENLRGAEDLVVYAQMMALCKIATVPDMVVKIHHHGDSLRHNVNYAIESGLSVVDEMFDAPMPEAYKKYRDQFYVRRCLSLSRTLFLAGENVRARHFFILALKNDWTVIFSLSYLRKFIKSFFKSSKASP